MDLEITLEQLAASLEFLKGSGSYYQNIQDIYDESVQLSAGNIPHKILLSEDGYLQTKITKEKVVLQ